MEKAVDGSMLRHLTREELDHLKYLIDMARAAGAARPFPTRNIPDRTFDDVVHCWAQRSDFEYYEHALRDRLIASWARKLIVDFFDNKGHTV